MGTLDNRSILDMLDQEAAAQGLPPEMARAIFGAENFKGGVIDPNGSARTDLVSPKGATGLMQVMPATLRALQNQGRLPAELDMSKPDSQIKAGVAAAKEIYDRVGGDRTKLMAAYNGGNAALRAISEGKDAPTEETRRYLKNTGAKMDTTTTVDATDPSKRVRMSTTSRDMSDVLDEINRYEAMRADQLGLLSAAIGGSIKNFENIATEREKQADVLSQGERTQGDIDAARAERQGSIIDIMGMRTQEEDSRVVQNMRTIDAARDVQDTLRPQIDQMDSVGILDNPIEWLMNQFQLPQLKSKYNAAWSEEQQAKERIDSDQRQAAAQINLDVPNIVDNIKLRASLAAEAKAADARVQAEAARQQSGELVARRLMNQMQVEGMTESMRIQVMSKMADTYQLSVGDAAGNKQLEQDLAAVNFQRATLGLQPFSAADAKRTPGAQWSEMVRIAKSGKYGDKPGDALANLSAMNASRNYAEIYSKTLSSIKPLLDTAEAEYNMELQKGTVKQKDRDAFIQNSLNKQFDDYQRMQDPREKRTTAKVPYYAIAPYEIMTTAELKDNPFQQYVQEQYKVKPYAPPTEKDLNNQFKALILNAQADPAAIKRISKQYSDYYRIGSETQWANRSLGLIGIPKPKEYVGDAAMLDGPNSRRRLQMYSPADMEALAMQTITQERRRQLAADASIGFNLNSLGGTALPNFLRDN